MKNTLLFCAICMSIAIAGAEPAAASSILIDFESIGLSEGQSLATEIPGMIFTNAIISEEGSPMTAFQGRNCIGLNDRTRDGENFGGFFITDPIVSGDASFPGTIEIQFNLPVFDLSFMVADIDNYGYQLKPGHFVNSTGYLRMIFYPFKQVWKVSLK